MQWSSHVQILLLVVHYVRPGRLIDGVSLTLHNCLVLLVGCSLRGFFDCSWHFHFPFEIHFRLLVALLPVFQLLVPPVNQMVASCDMIMPIVFNTFLSIFLVKVEFVNNLVEQFLFDWHLLFAGEKAHVSVSVFHEQGPSVVSNVVHSKPLFGICVQDSSNYVFALARKELGKSVFCTHYFLVQI